MMVDKIKNRIAEMASHITFDYDGKNCGIDPLARNKIDMWFGDNYMTALSLDEAMETPFFNGKSLIDIANVIKNVDM